MTKTARRVADPLRELGSKHAEVRAPAPAQAKFLLWSAAAGGPYTSAKQKMPGAARGGGEDEAIQADRR